MKMRKEFIRNDCCLLSAGQTVSMCLTVKSLFSFLISLSFLFLPFSLSLLPSFLTHLSSPPHLTQAALMGGTTMVMALVLPEQHCSLLDAYESCRALADAKVCCDYALHVGVTWWGPKVRAKEDQWRAWKHLHLYLHLFKPDIILCCFAPQAFILAEWIIMRPNHFHLWVKCVMT